MAKNTNIIIQAGTSINSNDGWIYGIDANEQQFKWVFHVYLIAMKNVSNTYGSFDITDTVTVLDLKMSSSDRSVVINELINRACSALQSLLEAIERGDKVWDAADHEG